MRKRDHNGFHKKKLNLRHIAGSRKWQPFLPYLNEIEYAEDPLGNWTFIQQCLIPSPLALYCRREDFNGKQFVRVFYEKKLPEELRKVLKEKCLEYA